MFILRYLTVFIISTICLAASPAYDTLHIPIELKWLQRAFIAESQESKREVFKELNAWLNDYRAMKDDEGNFVLLDAALNTNFNFQLKMHDFDADASPEYIVTGSYTAENNPALNHNVLIIIKQTTNKSWAAIYYEYQLASALKAEITNIGKSKTLLVINKYNELTPNYIESRLSFYEIKAMNLILQFSYIDYKRHSDDDFNYELMAERVIHKNEFTTIIFKYSIYPNKEGIKDLELINLLQEKYSEKSDEIPLISKRDSVMFAVGDIQNLNKPIYLNPQAKDQLNFLFGKTQSRFVEVFRNELDNLKSKAKEEYIRALADYYLKKK